jgi:hypothetical protein
MMYKEESNGNLKALGTVKADYYPNAQELGEKWGAGRYLYCQVKEDAKIGYGNWLIVEAQTYYTQAWDD